MRCFIWQIPLKAYNVCLSSIIHQLAQTPFSFQSCHINLSLTKLNLETQTLIYTTAHFVARKSLGYLTIDPLFIWMSFHSNPTWHSSFTAVLIYYLCSVAQINTKQMGRECNITTEVWEKWINLQEKQNQSHALWCCSQTVEIVPDTLWLCTEAHEQKVQHQHQYQNRAFF